MVLKSTVFGSGYTRLAAEVYIHTDMRVGIDSVKLRDMNCENIGLPRLMSINIQDDNDNGMNGGQSNVVRY